MQFDSSNLPKLGSEVWFRDTDIENGRPTIKSGLVFAQLLRYELSPLILVDVEAAKPSDMAHLDEELNRYDPEFLFDSAEAAGKSLP